MFSNTKNHLSSGGSNGGGGCRPPCRDHVMWTEEMTEHLIDGLLHQQDIGNRSKEGRFMTVAYDSIITGMDERFGMGVDRTNIKNRLKHIKETFHECENIFDKETKIKWNSRTRQFQAEPQIWRKLIEQKPEAKKWMTKTIDHYDKLLKLYGKVRKRCPTIEKSKGHSKNKKSMLKKKAKIEPSKEISKQQQTPSNGLSSAMVQSSNEVVPDEVLTEKSIPGELGLSEVCKGNGLTAIPVPGLTAIPVPGLTAIPVPANAHGKGLPYAPENWPLPGDEWYWKVGNRTSVGGHWVDRYLTPPSRFRDATGKKLLFKSRLKVAEFIKREFPDVDTSAYFSMFIWRIPSEEATIQRGSHQVRLHEPESGLADPDGPCKARNKLCKLEREGFMESSPAQDCDICCTEPKFCRECCCILCCRSVDYSFEGYGYIKCEAVVEESLICGHVAHLDCALRIYHAGTVGGYFDLDVQYYCRRCDNKTNLMMHVEKLLETCRSLESRDEIEPILNMGLCILRGSKQMEAKRLENYLGSALAKLKCGVDLAEVWKMEDNDGMSILSAEKTSPPTAGVTVLGTKQYPYLTDPLVGNELQRTAESIPVFVTGDHNAMSVKFEHEIDHALKQLKASQETERRLAEQKLYSQKDYILSLYRQLESERSALADPMPLADRSRYNELLSSIINRVEQVKREEGKLKAMLKVAKGFGKTPASVVQEHFGLSDD